MAAKDSPYVSGAAKLSKRIATIRAALAVPVLTKEIGELLLRRTLDRFEREVDPNYTPWRPLASSTLARRKRAGGVPGAKILQQTGAMKKSIKIIRGDNTGTIYTNTGAGVRIGIEDEEQVPKARAHQRGTPRIPVRKFLGIGSRDVNAVDGLLRRAASKAGL